jgi:hypothetical protein
MRSHHHAAAERDRLLRRLRGWTTACVVGAFGLAGVFSLLAATTFPGRTAQASGPSGSGAPSSTPTPAPTNASSPPTAAPATPAAQDPATPAAEDPATPQPPATGVGSGRGRHAGAVSGGS